MWEELSEELKKQLTLVGTSLKNAGEQWLIHWRQQGMNGTPEERKAFMAALSNKTRDALQLSIDLKALTQDWKSEQERYNESVREFMRVVEKQAARSGFSEYDAKVYVDVHSHAFEMLGEKLGLDPSEAGL